MKFFDWLFKRKKPERRKIGLALGSGGAKGFAEIGALKAFEENGIEFDIVAGTSIGSVIGAFYADGYSATDISELVKSIDLDEVKNFFMINMDTAGMFKVIDRTIGSKDIEELKKPFMAVATEVESGKEYVFDKGNVATALCASSSYPPFFKPVVIGNERYVDGAFSNSVPCDLVRKAGAEYVVGIDLSTHENKQGFLSRIIPTYKGGEKEPWKKGYDNCDVMLHPDLKGYKPIAFWEANAMYEIGYECAIRHIPQIKKDLSELNSKKRKKNKA